MTLLRGLDPSVKLPPWPMRTACAPFAGLSGASSDAALLSAMAAAAGVLYNASDTLKCLELPADPNYDGIWDYQWCTERLPQETYFTIDGVRDMFWARPANGSAVDAKCAAKYGVHRKGRWIAASSSFAAAGASNVIFSNGQYDPWRSGGVLTSPDAAAGLVAIEVPQGAHHLDLMFSNPADPPAVRAVRDKEVAIIRSWIGANRSRG
mmetsp:Transcript_65599/g.179928  ORF Transcript_65599/g.179928 Transcript_65599/m.179928 type:complete len:208 (+) Transcript_65599:108-731(+)